MGIQEMRKIKYRAWDDINRIMYYNIMVGGFDDTVSLVFIDDEWKNLSGEEILMQYTGLIDRNGKEIYEGDLLQRVQEVGYLWKVKFGEWCDGSKSSIGFYLERHPMITWNDSKYLDIDIKKAIKSLKVIGNIYENPELLK